MVEIRVKTERILRLRSGTPGPDSGASNDLIMGLSLGVLGDLFWLTLPEMRPILKRMLLEELDDAIERNRETWDISPFQICSEFCDEILEPALGDMPESIALAQRSCAALGQVVKIYANLNSLLRNAVALEIFERVILEPMRSQISKIDSELVAHILSIEKNLKR